MTNRSPWHAGETPQETRWVPRRLVAGTTVPGLEHLTAFVLKHVDGVSTVSEIAYATGLPHREVVAMLEELCRRQIVS